MKLKKKKNCFFFFFFFGRLSSFMRFLSSHPLFLLCHSSLPILRISFTILLSFCFRFFIAFPAFAVSGSTRRGKSPTTETTGTTGTTFPPTILLTILISSVNQSQDTYIKRARTCIRSRAHTGSLTHAHTPTRTNARTHGHTDSHIYVVLEDYSYLPAFSNL